MRFPIVAQDPRFGGGFRSFATAFWQASVELGHEPTLVYLSRARGLSPRMGGPRFAVQEEEAAPFRGVAVPSLFPELDALNQLLGGERIGHIVREAPVAFVVGATASYGWGALRSGRPYGCWLATDLRSELAARRARLPLSRRAALALSEPVLVGMERAVIRHAHLVATISSASQSELAQSAGRERDEISIWPVPIDMTAFRPLDDAAWEAGLDTPTIVFVGRIGDARKNVTLLLEAFRTIRRSLPGARLRLVGEPPPPAQLASLGDGVEAVGTVESIPAAIRSAALLVLPSLQEGFGIVVAEALACGVPAVVTPSGGPEELVRASGGGIVLTGWESAELAGTVSELLVDRRRLREMRRAGRTYVECEHSQARFIPLVAAALAELERAI